MVTSTAATILAFPTVHVIDSPHMNNSISVWRVRHSGDIYEDYVSAYDSYGSPYTAGISIWNTYPDGTIVGNHDGYFYSYGMSFSPDIRYTSFWWVDISGAPDSYLHNDVSYSYGNFSPYTYNIDDAWQVIPGGDVNGYSNSYIGISYG